MSHKDVLNKYGWCTCIVLEYCIGQYWAILELVVSGRIFCPKQMHSDFFSLQKNCKLKHQVKFLIIHIEMYELVAKYFSLLMFTDPMK